MRTNRMTHPKGAIACAMALLGLATGASLANATHTSAPPNTTPYHLSSHPMISGTVVAVNDREMVVDTDQGQQVTLEMDTQTSAPRDLAPGMIVRTDFRAMENCRLYAQRVMAVRGDTSTERLQAYANSQDEVREHYASADAGDRRVRATNTTYLRDPVTETQTVRDHSPGMTYAATPATADYAYSTRPMITGTVESVNDHHMVVATDQGQRVGLAMDSRTMIPANVGAGSIVRIDFQRMRDGRYYAKGVHRITEGMLNREQAYAHTRDSEFLVASNPEDCWSMSSGGSATTASTAAYSGEASHDATTAAHDAGGTTDENGVPIDNQTTTDDQVAQATPDENAQTTADQNQESLPRTASNRPVILIFGALALGAAALLFVRRRYFTA
jgi:LPXTG-motif cell wall-anchored protein